MYSRFLSGVTAEIVFILNPIAIIPNCRNHLYRPRDHNGLFCWYHSINDGEAWPTDQTLPSHNDVAKYSI